MCTKLGIGMAVTALIALLWFSSAPKEPALQWRALMEAIGERESSGDWNAIHFDDGGTGRTSKGKYQFQKPRWLECGGTAEEWHHMLLIPKDKSLALQDRVMRREINMALMPCCDRQKYDLHTVAQQVAAVAYYHNMGHVPTRGEHVSGEHRAYAQDIVQRYARLATSKGALP